MNKKVLSILAASAAVVGSAFFAAPARAVTQDVDVELTVDEVLFLRTFERVELRVTQGDLSGDLNSERDFDVANGGVTDGTAQIDLTPPNLLTESDNTVINKTVNELYAVWTNEDSDNAPTVTVRVAPGGEELTNNQTGSDFRKAVMSVVDGEFPVIVNRINPEFDDDDDEQPAQIGGVTLSFEFQDDEDDPTGPIAGVYTGGTLTVEATSIQNGF